MTTAEQGRVSAKDWDEALRLLASLGVDVSFFTENLTEERKPAIVSLSRALLALKNRNPQIWEKKRRG